MGAGYVERMIPDGDRFWVFTSDNYVAWIANDGSSCQGVAAPRVLFFGDMAVRGGYLYVAEDSGTELDIGRLKLPD